MWSVIRRTVSFVRSAANNLDFFKVSTLWQHENKQLSSILRARLIPRRRKLTVFDEVLIYTDYCFLTALPLIATTSIARWSGNKDKSQNRKIYSPDDRDDA